MNWLKRQYLKFKLYYKMIKSLNDQSLFNHRWYRVQDFENNTVCWKHNPYYFYNMGELSISHPRNIQHKIQEDIIFLPFPIYEELFELMNS